jgi:hypothetical protein
LAALEKQGGEATLVGEFENEQKHATVVYTTVRRIPLFTTPSALEGMVFFLGEVCGIWYLWDDIAPLYFLSGFLFCHARQMRTLLSRLRLGSCNAGG